MPQPSLEQKELFIELAPDKEKEPETTPSEQTNENIEQLALETPAPAINNPSRPAAPHRAVNRQPVSPPSGNTGDVARHEPVRDTAKRQVNPNALFQSQATQDPEQAPQSGATILSNVLFTGTNNTPATSTANASSGNNSDTPQYELTGRSVVGKMPLPEYTVANQQGKVIIKITVNEKGIVTQTMFQATGSTTGEAILIEAAKEAALKTRFTKSNQMIQYGTITYIFRLK